MAGGAVRLTTKDAKAALGPEGYELTVTPDSVVIRASDQAGMFYGVQSLLQLRPPEVFALKTVSGQEWQIPCVQIEDQPRFKWRGLLFDVARHFFTKAEVKQMLDVLALHKINTLHLHLTDDQGWRIEIKKYPELALRGSRKDFSAIHPDIATRSDSQPVGGYYTQDDIRELVRGQIGNAEVSAVKVEDIEDAEKPLTYSYRVKVPGYAQRTGKRLFVPLSYFQHGHPARFPASERKYPVCFEYPWTEEDNVTIKVPKGFALENAESPASFGLGSVGEYRVSAKAGGGQLRYHRKLIFGRGGALVCHAAMAAASVMVRMAAENTGARAARGPSGCTNNRRTRFTRLPPVAASTAWRATPRLSSNAVRAAA